MRVAASSATRRFSRRARLAALFEQALAAEIAFHDAAYGA